MKKFIIFLILSIVGVAHYTFSQSLVWERTIDTDLSLTSYEQTLGIDIADTGRIFQNFISSRYNVSGGYFPQLILALNGSGIVIDTIINPDTSNGFYSTIDRSRKRLWIAFRTENSRYPTTIVQKMNFRGFTLVRKDFRGSDWIDSLPAYIFKLLPAEDGGFYMLTGRNRFISGQNAQPWQVSRWDSLGNRRWVKEYLYTYAFGQPQQAEFLPNGNIFVSGWAGREIMALEIDTATGRAVNRKVLFTHPQNVGWGNVRVVRSPGGYYIQGSDTRSGTNRRFLFARVEGTDSLRMVWGGLGTIALSYPTSMADTTVWVTRGIQNGNYKYLRFGPDSSLLVSINLSSNIQTGPYFTTLNSVAHFNDLSAVFGGNIQTPTTQGSALYLCKIDSIGTPYNPVYPPVGPVPVATKNRIVEPDLQVFPNPFTHTLRISHKGTMQLMDIHGRKVIAQAVEAGQELNTGSLPRGMYLLRFTSTAGKGYVRKVVRE